MSTSSDLILIWPKGQESVRYTKLEGYSIFPLGPDDDPWVAIHRLAIPVFSAPDLQGWLARYRSLALTDGILVAYENASGAPVATAGSLTDPNDRLFPLGGQLGWVATVPAYRKRGLATWLCGLATERLVTEGFENIFLRTGDDLVPALHVYLRLGYVPCLYAQDQKARWEALSHLIPECQDQSRWVQLA